MIILNEQLDYVERRILSEFNIDNYGLSKNESDIIIRFKKQILDEEFYKNFLTKFKIAYNLGEFKRYGKKNNPIYVGTYINGNYELRIFIEKNRFTYYCNDNTRTYCYEGSYKDGKNIVVNYSGIESRNGVNSPKENWYSGEQLSVNKVLTSDGREYFNKKEEIKWDYYQDVLTKMKRARNVFYSFSNFTETVFEWRQFGYIIKKSNKKYEDFVPKDDEFVDNHNYYYIGIDRNPNDDKIPSYGFFAGFDGKISDYLNSSEKLENLYNSDSVQKILFGHGGGLCC